MSATEYRHKEPNYFEDGRKEMHRFVPLSATRLLEIGCGNGAFAASLKNSRNVHITAIEAYPPAAEIAQTRLDKVYCSNIESGLESIGSERFDCIILNDVLEHLVDPWDALRRLRKVLKANGSVVASIPNIRYLPVFKEYVFLADWKYREHGVLDKTHLRFFSRKSLFQLFLSSGYQVEKIEGINPLTFSWKVSMINKLLAGRLEDTRFKQFACVASPNTEQGQPE